MKDFFHFKMSPGKMLFNSLSRNYNNLNTNDFSSKIKILYAASNASVFSSFS